MFQIRHGDNHMVILPEAVLNSHDVVLPPGGKRMHNDFRGTVRALQLYPLKTELVQQRTCTYY